MRDLRFVGVDDEGTRLLLVDESGQQHQVQIDDALRTAVRAVRARTAEQGVDPNVRPRDVQAMLRSGLTIDEVAERTGWSVEKVTLFEPPIRAERDHVAITAQRLPLHTRVAGRDQTSTVGERVGERLAHRGVNAAEITWDAYRGDRGWTIECRFPAGGRPRVATWRYDAPTQSLHPTDDEARWLSEEDQPQENAPFGRSSAASGVYDVIAEGGLDQSTPAERPAARTSAPRIPHTRVTEAQAAASEEPDEQLEESQSGAQHSGPVDLVSVMRERSKARRRSGGRRKADSSPNHPAGKQAPSVQPPALEPEETDDSAEASDRGSVDQLGHDPVTGTADLFGLKEVGPLPGEVTENDTDAEHQDSPGELVADDAEHNAKDAEPNVEHDDTDDTDDTDREIEAAAGDEADVEDTGAGAVQNAEQDAPAQPVGGDSVVPERPSQARKGRPAVPSWDDIMFGKRGPKD